MAEGHTEDADALATYALCCVQLRSDQKQYTVQAKSTPKIQNAANSALEKEKIKEKVASELPAKNPPKRSAFLNFFVGDKEKVKEKEKEKEKEKGTGCKIEKEDKETIKHMNTITLENEMNDNIKVISNMEINQNINKQKQNEAGYDNQSTIVPMQTVPEGTIPATGGAGGGPNDSMRGMEILALIEVLMELMSGVISCNVILCYLILCYVISCNVI